MVIRGDKLAQTIINNIKIDVEKLSFKPVVCDIIVGNNLVSQKYVNLKEKKALSTGLEFLRIELKGATNNDLLIKEINKINQKKNICGLLVQLPLPTHIDRKLVLDSINPEIDVDVLGEVAKTRFYESDSSISPPTAKAIIYILDTLKLNLRKLELLVVGQGELVGRPVTHMLRTRGLSVKVADKFTSNLKLLLKQADVVISGIGKPKFIKANFLKPGCVVIDAGTTEDSGQIVGDVDFDSVKSIASKVSPVPGGVGPVTVAMLLKNVLEIAKVKNAEFKSK